MKNTTQIRHLTITAIFAALITVMTAYICHIPVPIAGGYMHFGDSLIFLAATILPTPYACAAAAIGGGLADLLTAPLWTFPTVIIKTLVVLPFTGKGNKILQPRNLIAPFLAYLISGTGYYIANTMLFDSTVAFFTSFLASAMQSLGSAAIFICVGMMLDRANFKKMILQK